MIPPFGIIHRFSLFTFLIFFMKRTNVLFGALLLLLVSACQKTEPNGRTTRLAAPDPTTLDNFIKETLLAKGEFRWDWASDDQVWTAVANTDHIMAVGFRPENAQGVEDHIDEINLQSPEWQNARRTVLDLILASERQLNPSLTEAALIAYQEHVLPVLDVRIENPATVALLRHSPWVRYAEPMAYAPFSKSIAAQRDGSGCDGNPAEPVVAGSDYTVISPACKSSWNYPYHNLPQAWNNSTGRGIGIMIVDSGSSSAQENLGSAFNQGSSTSRTITRLVTLPQATDFWGFPTGSPETPNDLCGHGTAMAGACAAPRGTDGASCGVAYNCNLTTVRAAADVYLDESREVKGVSDAFTLAGNTAGIRIVSMSMGSLTGSSQMTDAIKYAYKKGKLIFCAAGTSYSWSAWFAGVIYPANLAECVAVTGIKDNLTERCAECHDGSDVDFVVVMEQTADSGYALTLAQSGDAPGMVGGSSVATATTAGIAALVWAKFPTYSSSQVFNKMKTSASYYPSRHSTFGWGRVNAQLATQ